MSAPMPAPEAMARNPKGSLPNHFTAIAYNLKRAFNTACGRAGKPKTIERADAIAVPSEKFTQIRQSALSLHKPPRNNQKYLVIFKVLWFYHDFI